MGNSSSSARHQSDVATPRPSSASAAKKTAGKDQLPPMTTAGRKTNTQTQTTTSPSVDVAASSSAAAEKKMPGQGMEVPATMDEPRLTAAFSDSEEEEEETERNSNDNKLGEDDDAVVVFADTVTLDMDDEDDDDDDDSLDEYWSERQAVLADAKALAQFASWYNDPAQPVVVDGSAQARCYFDRPSAVPKITAEEEAELDEIMKDVSALKHSAGHFMHPERPVEVDAAVCGRNYFDRISASPYEDVDSDDDAAELAEERDMILAEVAQLKTWAGYYRHPERPVTVDDPTCTGRNYFNRASAPDCLDAEETKERDAVVSDMASLKTWAGYFAHPERPVPTDSTATARNYYTRPSAPEYNDEEVEMDLILKEAAQLKQFAGWYKHPERPVTCTDPCATGRDYYSRPSAPEYNDEEVEMDLILKEAAQLKQLAGWYKHPERPVECTDPCATGRDYFSRPSAPEYNDEEVEMDLVLKEAAQLKQLAGWYKHPERPVECTDPCATARNYFNRASAPVSEDEDMAAERDLILADMAELKKVASWYMHPERSVEVDPTAFGLNYFSRPSAADYDGEDDRIERERVLAEAGQLKKLASWYHHPEKPVVTTDPCAIGRNYFTRPSAPEYEDFEEEYQRDMVLSDIAELKQLAINYRHPEMGVVTSDPCATGRNFFDRASAPPAESLEEAEERTRVLQDAAALKKLATDYLHPEIPMASTVAVGRDFFSRPSAPEYDDAELKEQRDSILADAQKLKELAGWYHHPETGVTSSIAVTRNFFTRPGAVDATPEEEEEKALILADAAALKKLAVDYAHPEKPVVSKVNCVRSYFDRPSAEGHADYIHSQGHAIENEHHNFELHDYHQYDHHHHHDDDHSNYTHQSDHFEMDEDIFHGFRESLYAAHAVQEQVVPIIKEDEGEEGKLSRSPSSVMLFDQEAM